MTTKDQAIINAMVATMLYQELTMRRLTAIKVEALEAGDTITAQAATLAMLRMP